MWTGGKSHQVLLPLWTSGFALEQATTTYDPYLGELWFVLVIATFRLSNLLCNYNLSRHCQSISPTELQRWESEHLQQETDIFARFHEQFELVYEVYIMKPTISLPVNFISMLQSFSLGCSIKLPSASLVEGSLYSTLWIFIHFAHCILLLNFRIRKELEFPVRTRESNNTEMYRRIAKVDSI